MTCWGTYEHLFQDLALSTGGRRGAWVRLNLS